MDVVRARKELLEIKGKLDSLGIPFWLREGTLLAAVRDGEFFDWDHDMDISVRVEDWPEDFRMKKGWQVTSISYLLGRTTNVDLRKASDLRTCVMLQFYDSEHDAYITLSPPYGDSMRTVMPAHYMDEPNYIEFLGTEFRIPCNPEEVLESIYGDWQIPIRRGYSWREGWGKIEIGDYLKGVV